MIWGRYERWAVGAVIVAASFLYLWQLGAEPFQDYDESTYAQVVHEEVHHNDWLTFTFADKTFLEKPPLYFWLAGVSEKMLGESEFSLRLPSALAGIGLIALVMLIAFELGLSPSLAGAIALTTAPLLEISRQVRIDSLLVLCIMLAVYGYVRGRREQKWLLLVGFGIGLAVLTKSVVGVFAVTSVVLYALSFWDRQFIRNKYLWHGIVLGAVIALPWHIYEWLKFGGTFFEQYLLYHVFDRAKENLFGVTITTWDYIWYLSTFAFPWTQTFVFASVGAAAFWYQIERRIRAVFLANALSAIIIFLAFAYAATKAPTYLLPLYPFMALAIAAFLTFLYKKAERLPVLLITLGLFGLGGASTIYSGFHHGSYFAQGLVLASDEKNIGQLLKDSGADTFYAFDTTTLGSIMFYSGKVHPLAANPQMPANSYLVLPSNARPDLYDLYPVISTEVLYSGSQLSLVRIMNND